MLNLNTGNDFLKFLLGYDGFIPIYILNESLLVYSLVMPKNRLTGGFDKELLNWDLNIGAQYGWGYNYKKEKVLFNPHSESKPSWLSEGEPIFFFRKVFNHTIPHIELNQKIAHILDIFDYPPKNGYCKLDENGDYSIVATSEDSNGLKLCTMVDEDLYWYLDLTDSVLIRFFDVKINVLEKESLVNDFKKKEIYVLEPMQDIETDILYSLRGFQIIRSKFIEDAEKKYETFWIHDIETKEVFEWSCNPNKLGNVFEPSQLPFEISPAYFDSEVLYRYTDDKEKYTINTRNRLIECRGGWSLRYGVTGENRIFVYIKDLSKLPYNEQMYWRSFNKEFKSDYLPEHIIKTDFEGKWHDLKDSLNALISILNNFPSVIINDNEVKLWELKKSANINDIVPLLTDSKKKWEEQIIVLHHILIEGLNSKKIKKIAKNKGCFVKKFKSVKQLEQCLIAEGVSEKDIYIIMTPLKELVTKRDEIAHYHPKYPLNLEKDYKILLENCYKSMEKLAEIIKTNVLNI